MFKKNLKKKRTQKRENTTPAAMLQTPPQLYMFQILMHPQKYTFINPCVPELFMENYAPSH